MDNLYNLNKLMCNILAAQRLFLWIIISPTDCYEIKTKMTWPTCEMFFNLTVLSHQHSHVGLVVSSRNCIKTKRDGTDFQRVGDWKSLGVLFATKNLGFNLTQILKQLDSCLCHMVSVRNRSDPLSMNKSMTFNQEKLLNLLNPAVLDITYSSPYIK